MFHSLQSKFKRSPSLKSLTDALGFVKKIRERKPSGGNNKGDDLAPEQRLYDQFITFIKKLQLYGVSYMVKCVEKWGWLKKIQDSQI